MAEVTGTIATGIKLIKSSKEEEFKEGFEILGYLTNQTVIKNLKDIAESPSNVKKRDYARKALDKIANRLHIDSWKEFFEKADHFQKKITHKLELYKIKREKALKIVKILELEENPFAISSLIKQLGNFKDPDFIQILVMYLNHDDARVRANTVEAIDIIGEFNNKIIKFLVTKLSDESGRVKANTIKVLAKLNIIDIKEGLVCMLDECDKNQTLSALYAISELNDSKLYPLLEKALVNADDKIRMKVKLISKRFTLEKYRNKTFRFFRRENLIYIVFVTFIIINFVPMIFNFTDRPLSPEKYEKTGEMVLEKKNRIQSLETKTVLSTCVYKPSKSLTAAFCISNSEHKYIESVNNRLLFEAQVYIQKKNLSQAISILEKAIRLYPNDPIILMQAARKLCWIYRKTGNNEKAKHYWKVFIKNQKNVSKKYKSFF